MRFKKLLSLTLMMLALCVGRAYAQFETASLVGRVTDASGAVVPGATVTATNADTNVAISRLTNKDGEYSVPALNAGTYRVVVTKNGFAEAITDNVRLEVGTNQRVDLKMIAGSTETVTVQANQLALETDTSQKQQVITTEEIDAFPLLNMNYSDLVQLSTGRNAGRRGPRPRHQQRGS